MILTFNVPDDKVSRVVDAMNGLYECPETFTKAQWAKECIRQFVMKVVSRWETICAQEEAKVSIDTSIITLQE